VPEEEIGQVSDYFAKIGVAGIDLTGTLSVGDTIHIVGHTTDLTQVVESMEIEHEKVEAAHAGQSIGIKLTDRARKNDRVYKVVE
jgi:putative protease